ncbi:MAG: beta-ketoacyl-ACP synthase II [Actinobacteria bacterium]|nr:beta-ketoacyl-ACP synthase II [Actinomycetota bacterium]
MTTDIAITGLGLVTPAGIGVDASWQGVLSGRSAGAKDPNLEGIPIDISCRVADFDGTEQLGRKAARRLDRFVQLGLVAAREAIADSGLDPQTWDGARVGAVMGCGMGGAGTWETQHTTLLEKGPERVSPLLIPMLIPNMVAGHIAIEFNANGPNLVTATACTSGATAIGVARDLLRTGACDVVITGGTEAGLTPLSIAAFGQMHALSGRVDDPAAASRPFDADRDGFVAAEAGGVLILERADDAAARGATVRARLLGYGASADAYHITAPDPDGVGVGLAITAALDSAGITPRDVDHINAHGTSTPLNDAAEGRVINRIFDGDTPPVTSTKGVTGHSLGAAGAIEAAFAVLTIQHGRIPPTANLDKQDPEIDLDVVSGAPRDATVDVVMSNSFGFGGQNGVLVLASA